MANFNKKWGTVMACWCVALVMIITGVCLALTIPSSAADEEYHGEIAVLFDGDAIVYNTFNDAFSAAMECNTTDTPVTLELRSDVIANTISNYFDFEDKNVIIDLNGHYFTKFNPNTMYLVTRQGGSLTFIDSNPDVEHYVHYVGDRGKYEFVNEIDDKDSDEWTLIKGGVFAVGNLGFTAAGGELTLDGGTYLANKGDLETYEIVYAAPAPQESPFMVQASDIIGIQGDKYGRITINEGATWRAQTSSSPHASRLDKATAIFVTKDSLTVNGGTIYGEVYYCSNPDASFSDAEYVCVDLTDAQAVVNAGITIKEGIEIHKDKVGDITVYTTSISDRLDSIANAKPADAPNAAVTSIILGIAFLLLLLLIIILLIVYYYNRKRKAEKKNQN